MFDRVRVSDLSEKAVASALAPFNEPGSTAALVQRTVLGMRLADTGIPDTPLVVADVHDGSPAATAGIKPGDTIETVERARTSVAQLADLMRQRQPGDILTLRIKSAAAARATCRSRSSAGRIRVRHSMPPCQATP